MFWKYFVPQTYNKLTLRESNNPDKIVEALNSVDWHAFFDRLFFPTSWVEWRILASLSKKVLQLNKRQKYKKCFSYYREWFQTIEIDHLDWPACSSVLNSIENLWGMLVRLVYKGGRQYKTVQELEVAINNFWREIRIGTFENLVNSMSNSVFEVIKKNGKKTKY